jgi:hypothetical protein
VVPKEILGVYINVVPISCNATFYRYIGVKPASVCVGDIIELQVSFIMIPLRDKQFKVTMVLRSILILDRTFTQVRILLQWQNDG